VTRRRRSYKDSVRVAAVGALLVLALPIVSISAGIPKEHRTFTQTRFEIVPENLAEIIRMSTQSGGSVTLGVRCLPCAGCHASKTAQLEETVTGAPPHTFRVGQIVATGFLQTEPHPIAAVRTVSESELTKLGCTAAGGRL
jgi:hypothetical protein